MTGIRSGFLTLVKEKCLLYAAKHDIVYNNTKTEYTVVLWARSKINYLESAQLSECGLNFADIFTYLGYILHRDMTDDADISKQTTKFTKFRVTSKTLLRKFSHRNIMFLGQH